MQAMLEVAIPKSKKKLSAPPGSLRMEHYDESPSVQIMHICSYDKEGPVLAELHDEATRSQDPCRAAQ
jgi:hypothetical protein